MWETVVERSAARELLQRLTDDLVPGREREEDLTDRDYHLALFRWREDHILSGVARRLRHRGRARGGAGGAPGGGGGPRRGGGGGGRASRRANARGGGGEGVRQVSPPTAQPVAILGGTRIPFARRDGPYAQASNQD